MNETARALLEAHVQHELDSFRDDAVEQTVRDEVARFMAWLEDVRLNDISSPDQVLGVIDRCVIDLRVSGGITELAGESANKVFSSSCNEETCVHDILPSSFVEDLTEWAVSLEPARRNALQQLTRSPAYREVLTRLLQKGIVELLFRPPASSNGKRRLFANLGMRLARRVIPDLERSVADSVARSLENNADRITRHSQQILLDVVDESLIRSAADGIWEILGPMRLGELFRHISSYDLDDFIVIGYEFWLKYRRTPHFRKVTSEVVFHIFDKYGEDSVRSLIEDMGVDEELVAGEAVAFVRPIVKQTMETGFQEKRIRARLEAFYGSEAAAKVLER